MTTFAGATRHLLQDFVCVMGFIEEAVDSSKKPGDLDSAIKLADYGWDTLTGDVNRRMKPMSSGTRVGLRAG